MDKSVGERVLEDVIGRTIGRRTPVQISLELHDLLVLRGGSIDPYHEQKVSSDLGAKELLPHILERISSSEDRLRTAAMAATAGNVIDFGAKNVFDLRSKFDEAMDKGMAKDMIDGFADDLRSSDRVDILADNSGECVMDAVLVREILSLVPDIFVYYWVKRSPILNDVTRTDALAAGIVEGPRVRIEEIARDGWISPEEIAEMHGVILSKGQGNYETLSGSKGIYFSLAIKCEVVAADIGVSVGDLVFFRR